MVSAPIVIVKLNGTDVPHVFAPSIFDKPVPYEEWEAIQTIKGKKKKQYYTSPYQFGPGCDVSSKDSEIGLEPNSYTLSQNSAW